MAKATEIEGNNGFEMGNPYYCKECKRNHTKGKIYKEHLNFALFENTDKKESIDDNIKTDNDDYDDEVELIEAFNEIENKENNFEVDNQLEDDFELILVNTQHIKHALGRKTGAKDCKQITQLLQYDFLPKSFIPNKE